MGGHATRSRPLRKSCHRSPLAAGDKPQDEWQRSVVVSLGKICDVKRDAGDGKGALEACEESLLGAAPRRYRQERHARQRDIAVGLERLGDLKFSRRPCRRASRLCGGSCRRPSASSHRSRQHGVAARPSACSTALAILTSPSGDANGALVELRRSSRDPPTRLAKTKGQCHLAARRLGQLAKSARQAPPATMPARSQPIRKVSTSDGRLPRPTPQCVWKRDLAVGWTSRRCAGHVGRLPRAPVLRAGSRHRAGLGQVRPANMEGQRDLSVTLDKIGDTVKAGDTAGAFAAYEEASTSRASLPPPIATTSLANGSRRRTL